MLVRVSFRCGCRGKYDEPHPRKDFFCDLDPTCSGDDAVCDVVPRDRWVSSLLLTSSQAETSR